MLLGSWYGSSSELGDCSWFSDCDLGDLRRPPPDGTDYLTTYVKVDRPPLVGTQGGGGGGSGTSIFTAGRLVETAGLDGAPAASSSDTSSASATPRIAIATVCVGAGVRCALLHASKALDEVAEGMPNLDQKIGVQIVEKAARS